MVEITDGTANTFGTASLRSNGNLLVGNGNTFGGATTTISGLAVIGDSNTVGASTGSSIGNGLVIGGSNTIPQMINGSVFGANNSITGGTGNLVFMMGNSHTTDSVTTVLIGDNNETLANDTVTVGHDLIARTSEQMVFGRRVDLPTASYLAGTYLGHGNASNSQPLLGIVRPATQTGKNVGNIGIGFGASTLYITGKNNAGDGILYIGNLVNQATEPTVTVQDSVGIWAKDRAGGGTAGLKMQVEDGTNHFLGDYSVIGGDQTDANVNKTLTVVGTTTGSGTSSLLCEDSGGTTRAEVKDNGEASLGNYLFDSSATVGAGQDNYVLTYDNASGKIGLEASGGGGSSLWTDNGNRITDSNYYITEINKGVANTFNSATYTVGNLIIGDGNTLGSVGNNMRGSLVFGETNTVGSTGSIQDCAVIGISNTLSQGNYSFVQGQSNILDGDTSSVIGFSSNVYGDKSHSIGDNNDIGTSGARADFSYTFGKNVKTKSDYQMAIGYGVSQNFNTKPYIGFGLYASASGTQQATAGFGIDPAGSANGAINFAMGGQNAFEDGIGINQNGAGNGIFYFHNYNGTRTVEPTTNIPHSVAMWGADSSGDTGLIIKSEGGTRHFFGGYSAIGGDETSANANTILTIAGEGTGTGYGLEVEDSAGTQNFAVRDDGVSIFRSYTVATVPTAVAGGVIYVSDETGGATMAFSDGTNWRRMSDRAIVS